MKKHRRVENMEVLEMVESMVFKIEKVKHMILVLLSLGALLAMMVCLICDYFITKGLSWSLVVVLSLMTSWLVLSLLLVKEATVRKTLIMLSIVVIPYLALLSMLLKRPLVFSLGACIAAVSCAGLWGIYSVFVRFHSNKLRALGISFFMTIPITWIITHIVTYFINDITTALVPDLFHALNTLLLAMVCFGGDYFIKRSNN